jgi:hypothetical protein
MKYFLAWFLGGLAFGVGGAPIVIDHTAVDAVRGLSGEAMAQAER